MSGGNMYGQVVSQVFTGPNGDYVYLYQVQNTGGASDSVIENFTISPMAGATTATQVGNLTVSAPTGFSLAPPIQPPIGADVDPSSGPTIGFGFPGPYYYPYESYAIEPGSDSVPLYVLSQSPPGMVTGNVIDGVVHSGLVVGPISPAVPEPSTLALLAIGALGLLCWARRRRI
jgi:hypothetical protein